MLDLDQPLAINYIDSVAANFDFLLAVRSAEVLFELTMNRGFHGSATGNRKCCRRILAAFGHSGRYYN